MVTPRRRGAPVPAGNGPPKKNGEETMKSKIVMTMFAAAVFGFTAGCAAQPAAEESPAAAQEVAPEVSHGADP